MTLKKTSVAILGLAVLPMLAAPVFAKGGGDRDHRAGFMSEADTNGDGALSAEEIEAHRAAVFAAADTDGNGSLSAEEMQASQERQNDERRARGMAKRIEALDTNGDGELSLEEMSKENRQAAMFKRLDTNEDGVISEEELAAMKKGRHGGKGGHKGERK